MNILLPSHLFNLGKDKTKSLQLVHVTAKSDVATVPVSLTAQLVLLISNTGTKFSLVAFTQDYR